jgi:hypothetical protein
MMDKLKKRKRGNGCKKKKKEKLSDTEQQENTAQQKHLELPVDARMLRAKKYSSRDIFLSSACNGYSSHKTTISCQSVPSS